MEAVTDRRPHDTSGPTEAVRAGTDAWETPREVAEPGTADGEEHEGHERAGNAPARLSRDERDTDRHQSEREDVEAPAKHGGPVATEIVAGQAEDVRMDAEHEEKPEDDEQPTPQLVRLAGDEPYEPAADGRAAWDDRAPLSRCRGGTTGLSLAFVARLALVLCGATRRGTRLGPRAPAGRRAGPPCRCHNVNNANTSTTGHR